MLRRPAPTHLAWLQRVLARVPSRCEVCHSWPSQPVCGDCLARLAPATARCPGCALAWAPLPSGPSRCPECLRSPLPLDACLAALDYAYPWRDLITQFKFQRQTGWTGFFTQQMLALAELRAALDRLEPEDWLLAMPLSRDRLAERGFNQAWELARVLHRHSGCRARLDARLLLRVRQTPAQSTLDRQARLRNLQGALLVDPLRQHELAGRRVLLVDDVMTTGASLATAALALRSAGAASVTGVVLARTPP